ncbi:hypothetical protein ACHAXA_006581 [Cyclostephanos tholiformis]|uniref:START domain-containing protein n=1 Tax=Cyclostephanos tholiformis TaxID=382380 RepID=A0ABD3RCB1_9STRA
MATQSVTVTLCTLLYVCIAANDSFAFTTGGSARDVHRAPVSNQREWQQGVEIELPNLEVLFDRIASASPLAKLVMEGNSIGGFEAIDDVKHSNMKWKTVEENKRKTVHQIHKLDQFQNVKTPLLRFRSSIQGPCIGELFSNFIMDLDERKKWDDQVARVEEMYPIDDLEVVNSLLNNREKYGTCTRVGVGYTQTKSGIISPREQLICGGMQEFANGATILWGTEMEECHNHLLPEGQRHTRAKSHLFAATLCPTSANSFDIEYLLQTDVGGGLPHFMTTPAVVELVKKLFEHARNYFEGCDGSDLDLYLKSRQDEDCSKFELSTRTEEHLFREEIDLSQHHFHAMKDIESLLFTT